MLFYCKKKKENLLKEIVNILRLLNLEQFSNKRTSTWLTAEIFA